MKKIITLLLCGFIISATSSFYKVYAFNDIKDNSTKDSVAALAKYNILNGYEDQTFRPENNITRAEFAKIIISTTKNEIQLSENSDFLDVSDNHWAKNYIDIAKNLGIVSGVSEKSFAPNDNITYEQAIKMIVVSLGYDNEAKENGGYPKGYMKIANDLGILKGVSYMQSEKANRGNIAIIIRNALDVEFYFIYKDGEKISREKSDITLFKLHEEAEKLASRNS